jgi:hypothetical protein
MITEIAFLVGATAAVGIIPYFISRVIRARSHRKKIAYQRSITSQAVQIGELIAHDNPELEAKARHLLDSPRAAMLHATAHYALAMVDDRHANFASMKEHLRFAVTALDRAPLPPTEKDAREACETRDAATLFFAFALAACGDLDEAEERLEKYEPVGDQHVGLRLRAAALILARREQWTALGAELNVPFDDYPMLGPSSKLLLRTLKERAASGQAYRASAMSEARADDDANDEKEKIEERRQWVAKALGEHP